MQQLAFQAEVRGEICNHTSCSSLPLACAQWPTSPGSWVATSSELSEHSTRPATQRRKCVSVLGSSNSPYICLFACVVLFSLLFTNIFGLHLLTIASQYQNVVKQNVLCYVKYSLILNLLYT